MLDPIQLQALVDGETDLSERKEILELCEQDPVNWRQIALAYMEEQAFAKVLGKSQGQLALGLDSKAVLERGPNEGIGNADCDNIESGIQQSLPLSGLSRLSRNRSISDSEPKPLLSDFKSAESPYQKSMPWRPFLAASIAASLIFVAGRYSSVVNPMNGDGAPNGSGYVADDRSVENPAKETTIALGNQDSRATLNAVAKDAADTDRFDSESSNSTLHANAGMVNQTKVQQLAQAGSDVQGAKLPEVTLPNAHVRFKVGDDEIPMYKADQVSPDIILAHQATELRRLQRVWNEKGYDVEVEPTYVAGELQDGRMWVIPVHQLDVTPIGQ